MKIAILLPEIYNCGPVNVALNLANFLFSCENVSLMIVSIRPLVDNETLDFFKKKSSLGVHTLDGKDYLKELKKITSDFDVIHSHGFFPDKLLSKLDGNIKKISTVHCMFYKDYPKEYGYLKGILGAFTHFHILRNGGFHHIIGCSDSVAEYCIKNNLKNVESIHNGVDQSRFKILSIDDKKKRKLDFGFEGKVFIYAGRFIRRKKVPELIEYFLKKSTDDSVLLLLGDGPEKEQCIASHKSKKLKFIGQVDNPEWYYQFADFVISNSSAEGYPMSIIEAISCGCYALLSDIHPHKELVENNPLCAKLLNEINFCDLTVAVINRELVTKLSAEHMALSYLKLYETNK